MKRMKLLKWKRVFICLVLTALALIVPAFAEYVPERVIDVCPSCGGTTYITVFNTIYCNLANRECSSCKYSAYSPVFGTDPKHIWEVTAEIPAACTADGSRKAICSNCGITATETIPQLDHDWIETSRIPATEKASGSVEYKCSLCGEIKTEILSVIVPVTPPDTPSTPTMTGLLATIGSVFSASMSWVSSVANTIAANPILLLCVVIGFIGTGVALFKRLLSI